MRTLTVFCALALALVCVSAAAEVQSVKVSGDITTLGIYKSDYDLDKGKDNADSFATITRLRVDADLTDNVAAVVGLINERVWDVEGVATTDVDLDLSYVTLSEALYSPLTLSIGRQNLRFGNALIVGDPDTNQTAVAACTPMAELSRRKSFDAIRGTLDYDPYIVDLVMAEIDENTAAVADDIILWGINVNYTFASYDGLMDVYYFSKHDSNAVPSDEVDVLGVSGSLVPIDQLTVAGELAYQFGDYNAGSTNLDRDALAFDIGADYDFDNEYEAMVGLKYSFRSGDSDTSAGDYEAWDVMYEDQTLGFIADANFGGNLTTVGGGAVSSNCHTINLSGSVKPKDDITLTANYYHFILDEKLTTTSTAVALSGGTFTMDADDALGDEIDLMLLYDYSDDVALQLDACFFMPGDAFDTTNDDTALAVVGSVSVAF